MGREDLGRRVGRLSALAEPVRRRLYLFVAGSGAPVSREEAAAGVGVAHHTARFHLDRLVADGLLEAQFRRPPGRTGPGAGRPTKLYVRSAVETAVAVPDRRYDLAGTLMARAIEDAATRGVPVLSALAEAAAAHGRALGTGAARPGTRPVVPPGAPAPEPAAAACAVLGEHGFEPRVEQGQVVLGNCPFHALVADHTALVCSMNLALLGGIADEVGGGSLAARLEPAPGRCCVVIGPAAGWPPEPETAPARGA